MLPMTMFTTCLGILKEKTHVVVFHLLPAVATAEKEG